jgi:lysophospholipid acyltransferase
VCHIHQQFSNWGGYQLDFTTVQMIFTIKLSQFGWNVYDGSNSDASPTQRKWGLKSVPSPLELLGYLFYFPGFSAGPAFEISDYLAFTDLTLFDGSRPSRFSAFVAFLKKIPMLVVSFVGLTLAGSYNMFWCLCDPEDEADAALMAAPCEAGGLSNGYAAFPVYQRIGYIMICAALLRHSYYFAWTLADMASTLITLSYQKNPKTNEVTWDRLTNCRIMDIEFGESMRTNIGGWNLGTAKWIRYYSYERLLPSVGRSLASNLSFLLSAFWHGFYPGYYITFFCGHIANEGSIRLRTWLRPQVGTPVGEKYGKMQYTTPFWYNKLGAVLASMALNTIVIPFVVLDLHKTYVMLTSVYFIPQIVVFTGWFVVGMLMKSSKKPKKKAEAKAQ